MFVFTGGVVCADEFTYTVASKTSVTSTDAPAGVTATFNNNGTNNKNQLTINKNMTLIIKGFTGKITGIIINTRCSNSATGTLNLKVGDTELLNTTANPKSSFSDITFSISEPIESSDDITLVLTANKTSVFCNSFKIIYEASASDTRKKTTLSFGEKYDDNTIDATIGESFTAPTATLTAEGNQIDGDIEYSSNNESVAKIDANTGAVTLGNTKGTATITATYKGNDEYKGSTASYTINLVKPQVIVDGYFDFENPTLYGKGESDNNGSTAGDLAEGESIKAGNVTLTVTKQNGTNPTRFWNDGLRTYAGAQHKLSVPNGYIITNIDIALTQGKATVGELNKQEVAIDYSKDGKKNSPIMTSMTVEYTAAVTTAASSFATYACDYAVDYSSAGLNAYTITLDEDKGTVAYNAIDGTTPAGKAVLVKGDASTTYTLAPSTEDAATVETALQISDGTVTAADDLYYGFATINGVSGFKLVQNGITIPAKKGYLKLTKEMSNAKTFYAFDGDATGIEETFAKNEADKAFAPMYNISGQRVGEGYKGIVIVNGKKYVK